MAGEDRRLTTQPESVSAMFIKPVIEICLRLFQFSLNQFFVKVVLCSILCLTVPISVSSDIQRE